MEKRKIFDLLRVGEIYLPAELEKIIEGLREKYTITVKFNFLTRKNSPLIKLKDGLVVLIKEQLEKEEEMGSWKMELCWSREPVEIKREEYFPHWCFDLKPDERGYRVIGLQASIYERKYLAQKQIINYNEGWEEREEEILLEELRQ